MSPARPLWKGRATAIVGIVLLAFSLRSAVASLSPLIAQIHREFDVPAVAIGLLGAAPPACYAVFGILTPGLERRFGPQRLAVAALTVLAVGLAARGVVGNVVGLLGATALVFGAVGIGNILMPPLVKAYFPDRLGLMTTAYTTTMAVATFLPPLVAVPLADATSWRFALAVWAVPAAVAIVPWVTLAVRSRNDDAGALVEDRPPVLSRLLRLPLAWAITAAFAASASLAYSSFMWLPTILHDIAGVSPAQAGVLLSLFAAIGLPVSLIVPTLIARFHLVRTLFVVAAAVGVIGIGGLLVAPATATWLWVSIFGLTALLFPLVLTLLGMRARTHGAAVALSGFVQSIGYAIAAVFPIMIGLLHDVTGGWTASLCVLAVIAVAALPAGLVAARRSTVEADWERRHGPW
jgi:CP family cyanate transporter-like MFS transporter